MPLCTTYTLSSMCAYCSAFCLTHCCRAPDILATPLPAHRATPPAVGIWTPADETPLRTPQQTFGDVATPQIQFASNQVCSEGLEYSYIRNSGCTSIAGTSAAINVMCT